MSWIRQQLIAALVMMSTLTVTTAQELFLGRAGTVYFRSNAPLEIISAQSEAMRGVVNLSSLAFAFSVDITTFYGFNSRIQRIHFMENYLEAETFPSATFTGKIIPPVKFDSSGQAVIRAKGILLIHGVSQERIIAATLTRSPDGLRAQASFSVILAEFGITVPKIVHQKVAETIYVHVDIQLKEQ